MRLMTSEDPMTKPKSTPRPPRSRLHEVPALSHPPSETDQHHRSTSAAPAHKHAPASLQCWRTPTLQRFASIVPPQRNGSSNSSGSFCGVRPQKLGLTCFKHNRKGRVLCSSRMAKFACRPDRLTQDCRMRSDKTRRSGLLPLPKLS